MFSQIKFYYKIWNLIVKSLYIEFFLFVLLFVLKCSGDNPLEGARPVLTTIEIVKDETIFFKGEKFQFTATGQLSNRREQETTFSVIWKSLDTNLVTIDSTTGIAEFTGIGTAEITATSIGAGGRAIDTQFRFQIHEPAKVFDGVLPVKLVTTSNSDWALITDFEANTINSIQLSETILSDPESILKGSFAVSSQPREILISDNSNVAFVLSHDISRVTRLDLNALPGFSRPCPPVQSGSNKFSSLYVDNVLDMGFIARPADTKFFALSGSDCSIASIAVGSLPTFVGGKPGSGKLVVIDKSTPTKVWIYSFQDSTKHPIDTDEDFIELYNIVPHPEADKIYIRAGGNRLYYILLDAPPASLNFISLDQILTEENFAFSTNRLFFVTGDGNISIFDTSSDIKEDPLDKRVNNPEIFPDLGIIKDITIGPGEKFAYILSGDNFGDSSQIWIYKYALKNREFVRAIPISGEPRLLEITQDGQWLLTLDNSVLMAIFVLPAF